MVKKYTSLKELFSEKAVKPDRIAFISVDEKGQIQQTSWGDFLALVNLKKAKYEKEKIGSIALIRSANVDTIATLFGSSLAGVRTVMLSPLLSLDELKGALRASAPNAIEIDDDDFEIDEIKALQACLQTQEEEKASSSEGNFIFFTSGTSGPEKPVELTPRAFLDSCYNGQLSLPCGPKDIILSLIPLAHVFGFVCTLLWPLCYGAIVALGRGLRTIGQDIALTQPTILPLIPSLATLLLLKNAYPQSCRWVLVGGGSLDSKTIAGIKAKGISFAIGYGLTEVASGVAISVNDDPSAMSFCAEEDFRIEKDGTVSVKSPALMEGYFHNPAATKAVVEAGWFHTSDLGFIDSAHKLHLLGRNDDVLVLANGLKINAAEIENNLASTLPGLDFALYAPKGVLSLAYYSHDERSLQIGAALQNYNSHCSFGDSIRNVIKLPMPLPRTKTGKIRRYLLV